jgi:spore germination protein
MNSYNSLSQYTANYINQISTATYSVTASGSITGDTPTEGVQLANANNDQAFACIQNTVNGGFSSSLAHAILIDPALRAALIQNTVNLLRTYGYSGANMDFEDMPAADRPYYNALIQEMADALHPLGYKLVVSVPGKTSDSPTAAWSGTFDYAALGRSADAIQLMTYDQNGPWGAPGPVSGLPWVENVVKYAVTQIPSAKVMIGLPSYGYDWNTTTNTGHKAVTWKGTANLIATTGAVPQWDAYQQSPWFTYTASADGSKHTVWYENGASISAKTNLVKKYALRGVSVWRLGLEDESFWKAVQAGLAP